MKVAKDFLKTHDGQMLHAAFLGFNHPITKKYMEFEVAPEKEFNEIIAFLGNYATQHEK